MTCDSTSFSTVFHSYQEDGKRINKGCVQRNPFTVGKKNGFLQTVHVIMLPAQTLGRQLNHTDSLCRKLFTKHKSLDRKQEIADSLGGSHI